MSILVQDYYKVYGQTVAADGITFSVAPGDILGLVGPNGAGKTTTLRAMAGILVPTRGRIVIAGHDMAKEPVAAKGKLAYVPDDPRLFDQLTVWEHFVFIAKAYRLNDWTGKANELLAKFELSEKRDALCSELSRGMRQKVAICCGYLHQPRAIMLDEPLTGLDPYGIRSMKSSIRKYAAEGAAIIVSSHLLSLVEDLCASVLVLHRGKQLLHASLSQMRQQLREAGRQETLEDLFFRLTEGNGHAVTQSLVPIPSATAEV
ncbi:MAG TPA: ABC transporter ATP-binding protein [Tepidisphaeraceae bacterium]|jgi:ABC-2 type transport system ATP-binding protein|nr:ABC transporter ATP-binding protein [Tepidisphaeraceae bacterium]